MKAIMTSRYKLITFGAFLLVLMSVPKSLQAQENITMAVGEWPPYLSQSQRHNGVVSHLISDIFAEMGITVTLHFLPWNRAYNEAIEGKYNATAIWMEKKVRKEHFIYSDEVLLEQFVFFHKKAFTLNWESIDDLTAFKFGGIQAYSYGPKVDQYIKDGLIQIDIVNRPQQNFKKLLKNRIDLFPFEVNVGKSILKREFSLQQREALTYHRTPFLNNSSFVLFPKTRVESERLTQLFNQQLNKFKESGKYDIYFDKLKEGYYDLPTSATVKKISSVGLKTP